MVTTSGDQFIASTSISLSTQHLYRNNGRYFQGVLGKERVGLANFTKKKLRDGERLMSKRRLTKSKMPSRAADRASVMPVLKRAIQRNPHEYSRL
jgi:hypothetical protein